MKCTTVNRSISPYVDGRLSGDESLAVSSHLNECAPCAARADQYRRVRTSLKALPKVQAPADLRAVLQVAASREVAYRRTRGTVGGMLKHWRDRFRLTMNNMMRPLALPFAGGLVSTIVLFSIFVPTYAQRVNHVEDIPTVLATDPSLMHVATFGLGVDEIAVDLIIDENGRVVDYSIPAGQPLMHDPQLRRALENTLVSAQFKPATIFFRPASGKARITLRRSDVEVKG